MTINAVLNYEDPARGAQMTEAAAFWRRYASRVTAGPWFAPALDTNQSASSSQRLISGRTSNGETTSIDPRPLAPPPQDFAIGSWRENFIILAKWSGRVLSITRRSLIAAVTDEMNTQTPEEEAEIPLVEISQFDRDLVTEGALFLWTIGYRVHASGQRSRESTIRFRRFPRWSAEEVERAANRVDASQLRIEDAE
jgi:hypothetical protein